MATYLKFHQLKRSPFEGRESNQLVLATASLRSAYADIRSSLRENSPRICISGSSGIGKSSFARALPKLLESEAQCVRVRDPGSHWSRQHRLRCCQHQRRRRWTTPFPPHTTPLHTASRPTPP